MQIQAGLSLLKFPRQIGLKRALCPDRRTWDSYIESLNGRSPLYTSLYSFERKSRGRPDYDSAVMDCAWWDFDANDEHDMGQVKADVARLIARLDGEVRLVFTGRGYHVYQLFREPVRGREWAHRLDRYEREVADGLVSLDGVGYPERLTRIPGTYNIKRRKWSVVIAIDDFMADPVAFVPPNEPSHNRSHLDPLTGAYRASEAFSLIGWWRDNPEPQKAAPVPSGGSWGGEVVGAGDILLPTCLDRAIHVSNPPHHVRVALAQTMAAGLRDFAPPEVVGAEGRREIEDRICDYIATLGWMDYNPTVTRRHVRSLSGYTEYPSPIWYRKHGLCDGTDCWFCGD